MFDMKNLRECEAEALEKLQEAWSPAARAASAASRKGRGHGKDYRSYIARDAFFKAGGKRTAKRFAPSKYGGISQASVNSINAGTGVDGPKPSRRRGPQGVNGTFTRDEAFPAKFGMGKRTARRNPYAPTRRKPVKRNYEGSSMWAGSNRKRKV